MNLFLLLLQFYKKKEIYLRQGSIIRYAAPLLGLTGGRIKFEEPASQPDSDSTDYRHWLAAAATCLVQ